MTILPQSPSNGKPVALYLRVSGEEQAQAGTITNQRDFLDDGVSGVIPLHRRSEGARLLEDVRRGLFGAVVVHRLAGPAGALALGAPGRPRAPERGGCVPSKRHGAT